MPAPSFPAREILLVALDTLRSHKVRTGLTLLGVIIGVTSVIAVAAIIEGLNRMVSDRVQGIGSRTYFLSRIPFNPGTKLSEAIRRRKYINYSDADYLRSACPSVQHVSAFAQRPNMADPLSNRGLPNEIRHGNESVNRVLVRGAEPEHSLSIPLFSVARGRFVTRYDVEHSSRVVVLGEAIALALFPSVDPLGKQVRVNGLAFEVIGVFDKDPGLFGGPGVDQIALMPVSTFRKMYPEIREVFLSYWVPEGVDPEFANGQVIEAMRRLRKVPHNAPDDFELLTPDFLTNLWRQLTGALVILTGVISSVGLLVGGIGVMNIMLISVTERTKEIGVRMAVGARRQDIRLQFLLEATILTSVGGLIGLFCGWLIAALVHLLAPGVPAQLSVLWVVLGLSISIGTGLFFGFYPASRAANLDPIECLRYE